LTSTRVKRCAIRFAIEVFALFVGVSVFVLFDHLTGWVGIFN
jgi:hypothetical protein